MKYFPGMSKVDDNDAGKMKWRQAGPLQMCHENDDNVFTNDWAVF